MKKFEIANGILTYGGEEVSNLYYEGEKVSHIETQGERIWSSLSSHFQEIIDSTGTMIGDSTQDWFTKNASGSSFDKATTDWTFLEELDVSKVTSFSYCFMGCTTLKDTPTNWNLNSATYSNYMFKNCTSLNTTGTLSLSKVTNASQMFYGCTGLQNANVTLPLTATITSMYYGCTLLEQPTTKTGTSLQYTTYTYANCTGMEGVTATTGSLSVAGMFSGCGNLSNVYLTSPSGGVSRTDANMFLNANSSATVYVPNALFSDWYLSSYWASYQNRLQGYGAITLFSFYIETTESGGGFELRFQNLDVVPLTVNNAVVAVDAFRSFGLYSSTQTGSIEFTVKGLSGSDTVLTVEFNASSVSYSSTYSLMDSSDDMELYNVTDEPILEI